MDKFQAEKETSTRTTNDLQLRLFNESHTRDVLADERVMLAKKNKELQSKNQQDNRIITKDKYHNDREETARSRRIQLDDLQAQINKVSEAIELEQEQAECKKERNEDEQLLLKQKEISTRFK